MGEPTFWMRIKEFYYATKHRYLCRKGIHVILVYDDLDGGLCVYCGKEFKYNE